MVARRPPGRSEARNIAAASKNIAAEYPQFGNLTLCVGAGGFMEWAADVGAGPHYSTHL